MKKKRRITLRAAISSGHSRKFGSDDTSGLCCRDQSQHNNNNNNNNIPRFGKGKNEKVRAEVMASEAVGIWTRASFFVFTYLLRWSRTTTKTTKTTTIDNSNSASPPQWLELCRSWIIDSLRRCCRCLPIDAIYRKLNRVARNFFLAQRQTAISSLLLLLLLILSCSYIYKMCVVCPTYREERIQHFYL